MKPQKMIPALPPTDEPEQTRFRRFAKGLLSVRRSEIKPLEQEIEHLHAEKERINEQITAVRRELGKRRQAKSDS